MSRERTRPTREDTRDRLFAAAAGVFAEAGVAGATVEQIALAAGFTRGAFYSNFADKNELAIAMLEDHLARSKDRNQALLHTHSDASGFVQAMRDDEVLADDPLHRNPLLQIELMLYVARTPELRPLLGERLRAMRGLVGGIAGTIVRASHPDAEVDDLALGTLLIAIEDGLRLHRIIDPETTPADAFLDALTLLGTLVAPDSGRELGDRDGQTAHSESPTSAT